MMKMSKFNNSPQRLQEQGGLGMKTFELSPIYDSRKSFYNKAKVVERADGTKELYSYNTLVSICKNGKVEHLGKWSVTTGRHQREFERQFAY